MNVLCVGMVGCDISLHTVPTNIFQVDHCDVNPPVHSTGGDALNVAINLSKLGIPVSIAGRIGMDSNGDFIKQTLMHNEIDAGSLAIDSACPTAVSYVLIDENKERHFLSSNQIYQHFSIDDVAGESVRDADIVYFGSAMIMGKMDHGGLECLFKSAKACGKTTILDAAYNQPERNWLELLSPSLSYTDYFLPSFDEARLITGKEDPAEMAQVLSRFGLKNFAVKLGRRGCFVTDFNRSAFIDGTKEEPIDTCGAGDAFVSAFICGLVRGFELFERARFANFIAGRCVGEVGASTGIPSFAEVKPCFKEEKNGLNIRRV